MPLGEGEEKARSAGFFFSCEPMATNWISQTPCLQKGFLPHIVDANNWDATDSSMKTQVELLGERIATACVGTKPNTRARNEALALVRWRLESSNGLCAGLDNKFGCALVSPPNAQVFDGRDNESLKKAFFETALGVELALVLLD